MTQNDLDNGRVVARVVFVAASPIERIHVILALDSSGQIVSTATEPLQLAVA